MVTQVMIENKKLQWPKGSSRPKHNTRQEEEKEPQRRLRSIPLAQTEAPSPEGGKYDWKPFKQG